MFFFSFFCRAISLRVTCELYFSGEILRDLTMYGSPFCTQLDIGSRVGGSLPFRNTATPFAAAPDVR